MRPTRVEIESFRGYNEPYSFDCLADVVVLCGPNGLGKTSFFDAITWALFGDIPRLRGSRDVVGDAHIRNYFSASDRPQVSVHLSEGDTTALVTRHGSLLRVVRDGIEHEGPDAEEWIARQFRPPTDPEDWTLRDAERRFHSANLLGQEEVAAFLRTTNPRDRFDALASLLGIDLVRNFYLHTAQVKKDGHAEIDRHESRLAELDQRLEAIRIERARLLAGAPQSDEPSSVERLLDRLQAVAVRASPMGVTAFLPTSEDITAADLLSSAQEIRAGLEAVVDSGRKRVLALRRIESELPAARRRSERRSAIGEELEARRSALEGSEDLLVAARKQRDTVRQQLADLRAAIQARRKDADAFAAFLLSAEAHVHTDKCPVCEQSIDPEAVVVGLRERAADLPEELRKQEGTRQRLEGEEREVGETAGRLEATVVSLREQIAALEGEKGTLDERDAELSTMIATAALSDETGLNEVAPRRVDEAARLTDAENAAGECDAIIAELRYLASADRRSQLADEEKEHRSERSEALEQLRLVKRTVEILGGLTEAAKVSEREIVERLMRGELALLNALYQRLRPHPVLDHLDLDFGEFGDRGEVYFQAVSGGKRMNVSATFSSAQLNAVAICIFLALNASAQPAAFALLDDPIQNMDDFNVLGLLRLLRSVSAGRQVIVSTHDLSWEAWSAGSCDLSTDRSERSRIPSLVRRAGSSGHIRD